MDDIFILIHSWRADGPGPFVRDHGRRPLTAGGPIFEIQGAIHAALVPFFGESDEVDGTRCGRAREDIVPLAADRR